MLRICNWIAGLFGYRLMKVQTFKCAEMTWTKPEGCKMTPVTFVEGRGGPGSGGSSVSIDEFY